MLRKSGSRLPVQAWFPQGEEPPQEVESKLLALGVDVRSLPVPSVLGKVRSAAL